MVESDKENLDEIDNVDRKIVLLPFIYVEAS